jgi:hypothetical protein
MPVKSLECYPQLSVNNRVIGTGRLVLEGMNAVR